MRSKIRVGAWLIAITGAILAIAISDFALNDAASLNLISYWGTVVTVIAFLLAVAEIAHSIQTTKSLQRQTEEALNRLRNLQDASVVSDCIAAIDIITKEISDKRYDAALSSFQHLRKLCVRTIPEFHMPNTTELGEINEISQLEFKLMAATRSGPDGPLTIRQKQELLRRLLAIKDFIERKNPANRT